MVDDKYLWKLNQNTEEMTYTLRLKKAGALKIGTLFFETQTIKWLLLWKLHSWLWAKVKSFLM